MSIMTEPLPPLYAAAIQYGMRGLRLLPVERHTRRAILPQWERNATNDVTFIDRHFDRGLNNIGLCCGPQPGGWNLLVIDVDPQNGGDASWAELEARYGPLDRKNLCFHRTPSGGVHLFFDVPEGLAVTGTDVLGPGIDARGGQVGNTGCGYVLLPPSIAASKTTGELLSYGASPGKGLLDRDPGPAPEWVLDHLMAATIPEPRQVSMRRHPSMIDGDDPWSWTRAHLDWDSYLGKHGWQRKGKYWWRPGKDLRQEHAAELHDDGRFAYWSLTDMPAGMRTLGRPMADGGRSISLADFICAYEDDGDREAFGRRIREQMMPRQTPAQQGQSDEQAQDGVLGGAEATSGLNLPPAFWTARPWLTHVRDAAWAMGTTPDGQLMALLTHLATTIPPSVKLPAIVRAKGTMDLITVIVGPTGAGKSSSMRRAEEIAPSPRQNVRFGLGLSSGEGLLEAYFGLKDVSAPGEKPKTERARIFDGVNVVLDEGRLLLALAGRNGFTGIEYLLSAWSGSTLSTPNAASERFRHIPAGTVRFTCTLGIQVDLADGLWAGTHTAQGFTGRLLFGRCQGGDVPPPGKRPADPGVLGLEYLPDVPMVMTFPPEVWEEVQVNDYAKQSPTWVDDPLNAHRDLVRMKVAGILASVEGRTGVTVDDWDLATQVVDVSSNVREWLQSKARVTAAEQRRLADEAKGRSQVTVATAEHAGHVARVARRILTKITREGLLVSELRHLVAHRDRKAYADEAIASLVEAGLAFLDGDRIHT